MYSVWKCPECNLDSTYDVEDCRCKKFNRIHGPMYGPIIKDLEYIHNHGQCRGRWCTICINQRFLFLKRTHPEVINWAQDIISDMKRAN